MFVDTHCHLESIGDLESVLLHAEKNGITKIITVGTSIEFNKKNIEIAEKYSSEELKIYVSCGIHPKDGKDEIEKFGSLKNQVNGLRKILKQVQDDKIVVGVGETGLDYRLTSDKGQLTTDEEKDFQRELFREQIKLAQDLKLPLVIHCRNAWDDVLSLLTTDYRLRTKITGVFHSWTGDWQAAQKALDLGFYISFSGIVTFKNAKDIQEVARKIPLEKLLLETDSPYLSPEPLRRKQNEPKNVKIVGKFIADLRNQTIELISSQTSANATILFKI